MKVLRYAFFVCLIIWIGGGLITYQYGTPAKQVDMLIAMTPGDVTMMNLRGISLNFFGPLAIFLGFMLAGVWGYRRLKVPNLPADQVPAQDTPPIERKPEANPKAENSIRCDYSGWIRDGNRIVQEYSYGGGGLDRKLAVEFTVEKGSFGQLRFLNFWLIPSSGHEGPGQLKIVSDTQGKSPGWLDCRMTTATGGVTLINIIEREAADAIFSMLSVSDELSLTIRLGGEDIVSLPLPNDAGLLDHYQALREGMAR